MSSPTPTSSSAAASSSAARNDFSPPTSLAVTVFIAAFAVIFALFGGFLVIGLIRRRRNPERYGPRPAMPGRAKQTRKKGLAMAVLESIPVVRFGANNKTTEEGAQKDIELAAGLGDDESTGRTSRNSGEVTASSANNISQPPPAYQSSAKDLELGTGTECSICIADFVDSEEVRVLPCHHRFHPACIDPWLLNVSGTCPICRFDLQPSQPDAPAEETNAVFTAEATPATTLAVPSPTVPRDRTSFRSRLREIRQSAHTGPEYISALRHLHRDHERRRPSSSSHSTEAAPQEPRAT
ncbi:hypothetical protein BKA65DRAFT_514739 [Rhexocercosporidium sp. MPI-PUGE-AT-0058]|nr:hypothetical protein BKA65DRAFT_514739 [Rhexocercosporidium sp. MPI-PUGE-AT-0058]